MYSYLSKKAAEFCELSVSILIQVVNVFIFNSANTRKNNEESLNPYSGGKCIHMKTLNFISKF